MVRISVLADALKTLYNAEKRGKKQGECANACRPRWVAAAGNAHS